MRAFVGRTSWSAAGLPARFLFAPKPARRPAADQEVRPTKRACVYLH
jgi:hypothetical protein